MHAGAQFSAGQHLEYYAASIHVQLIELAVMITASEISVAGS
jgi:hypothetical protein